MRSFRVSPNCLCKNHVALDARCLRFRLNGHDLPVTFASNDATQIPRPSFVTKCQPARLLADRHRHESRRVAQVPCKGESRSRRNSVEGSPGQDRGRVITGLSSVARSHLLLTSSQLLRLTTLRLTITRHMKYRRGFGMAPEKVATRFRVHGTRSLTSKKVTASSYHRTIRLESSFLRGTRAKTGPQGMSGRVEAGLLLPVAARF
jgi:hypothetical protein